MSERLFPLELAEQGRLFPLAGLSTVSRHGCPSCGRWCSRAELAAWGQCSRCVAARHLADPLPF